VTKREKVYKLDSYVGNIVSKDIYITGSLETEPEFIEYRDLIWQKKAQSKFTEAGRDGYVFQATHPRGFILIVYPYWMVDREKRGWEFLVFLKGWEREWDSWEERDGKYHVSSYILAMRLAVNKAEDWKVNPNHPEFPVSD
jgi:hypothetical protein